MATPGTGLVGVGILLLMLLLGIPIGCALGLVGAGGLILIFGLEATAIKAGAVLFDTLSRYELGTLPLFLLMAHLCFSSNASKNLFDAAASCIGHRRGGLALASVAGCAGFGAINGSSLATAATIGQVAIPEMRRHGYSDSLATGTVAAGGTLGQMIPPSGALIVFGIITQQSIGTLFTAAIVPGLTQMLLYFVVISLLVRWRPDLAPLTPKASWAERRKALLKVADVLLLMLGVIGGIAFGWFTPSEAASMGVAGALLICFWRGRLSRGTLYRALEETLKTSGLIYTIVVGTLVFSVFISVTGLADAAGAFITGLGAGHIVTLLLMALFLLLLGSVLDGLALMLLATPILLPVITEMGLSPIWFGIFIVRAMEIGFIHPPTGMNLYVIQGVAPDVSITRIFRGVTPFLASDFLHLLLLILFPVLALALPGWLS
ncbi:MAG TPA: TRAP transporter large permease [Pseudomonadaceae bacterium]|nr:TRAP transporter large permease [Pseudomonadaceae bacterium]